MKFKTKWLKFKGSDYLITAFKGSSDYGFSVANITKNVSQLYLVEKQIAWTTVSSSGLSALMELSANLKSDIFEGRI